MNHTKLVLQKIPVNACGVRDGLSGDMLVSSRRNLVFHIVLEKQFSESFVDVITVTLFVLCHYFYPSLCA